MLLKRRYRRCALRSGAAGDAGVAGVGARAGKGQDAGPRLHHLAGAADRSDEARTSGPVEVNIPLLLTLAALPARRLRRRRRLERRAGVNDDVARKIVVGRQDDGAYP